MKNLGSNTPRPYSQKIMVLLEILLGLIILSLLILYFFSLLLVWSWAQSMKPETGMIEIFSTAAIEWGAVVSVIVTHLRRAKPFFEAPPLKPTDPGPVSSTQLPVIFVPSLHTGASLFNFLLWRLKKHYFASLWPYNGSSFLKNGRLIEDEIEQFIEMVLTKTGATQFKIVSFGSSRTIIAKLLEKKYSKNCKKWIAVSAPEKLSPPFKLLSSERLRSTFQESEPFRLQPDLLIVGTHDSLCYPEEVWGAAKRISVPSLGHYSVFLHSTTTQKVLEALQRD